ncbi:MAG: biotin/lipoyl-binding protein [Candidatus Marinimicrobia bacterium]|nr:biotin/lipoyl-binding protein [Candidatus Neomarinimicrobiota bacterium]
MKEKEFRLEINGNDYSVIISDFTATTAAVEVNGKKYKVGIKDLGIEQIADIKPQFSATAAAAQPAVHAGTAAVASTVQPQLHKPASIVNASAILSPLPGLIQKVLVKVGDPVAAGQNLLIMEAMKMENEIQAKAAGTVTAVNVKEGDSVEEGIELVVIG